MLLLSAFTTVRAQTTFIIGPLSVDAGASICYQLYAPACSPTGYCFGVSGGTSTNSTCQASGGGGGGGLDEISLPGGGVHPLVGGGCTGTQSIMVKFNNVTTLTNATINAHDNCSHLASISVSIVPPLSITAVSISPSTQTIPQNSPAGILTMTGSPTKGNNTYTYQWQSSIDNTNWNDIAGATSTNYSPGGLSQTTYFRLKIMSFDYTSYTSPVVINTFIPVPVNPGSLTPASPPQIPYNTSPGLLTLSGVSGGNGVFTYNWYSSVDNINWYPITGPTGTTYTPGNLTALTYYRVGVSSNSLTAFSNISTILVGAAVTPGMITPAYLTVASGTSPGILLSTPATGGNCGTGYAYQWQSSTDGTNYTNIFAATSLNYTVPALTVTTYYRMAVTCSGATTYSSPSDITVGALPNTFSYIRVRDITAPGIFDLATANSQTDINIVKQTTQYFDGLGREIQTVSKQQTPLGKDLVTPVAYDAYGRDAIDFMPYVATTGDGLFKTTAVQDQNTFNTTQFPGEQYYFAEKNYEPSPLNRLQAGFAPGISWAGSGRGVGSQYQVNAIADSVVNWVIAMAPGSIPTTTSFYPAGSLYKNITVDEAGHQVEEYKDMQGKVLLKRVQLSNTPGTGHVGWLSTYYIYDDLNNLRFVIQPRAIDLLQANGIWNLSTLTNLTSELCFRYEYDYRKRMIIKVIPGAGEVWMVYDGRDRLVMTQDANLRAIGKWMVVKYDIENRPDTTGLLTDANNRTYHQNLSENNSYYPNCSTNFELLTQTYYDGYGWASAAGLITALNTTYTTNASYFNTSYNTNPTYAQAIVQYPVSRGLTTGSTKKVIGTASQFLLAISFYDDHGRVIQSQDINQTGGKDTATIQYNFNGKVLRNLIRHQKSGGIGNVQTHSILTKFTYDAVGRLILLYKNIDNATTDQLISTDSYNELGQLQNKELGNNLDNLANVYNVRGWLTSINKQFISGTPGNYFGMELGYDKTASIAGNTSYITPEFNGNISGTVWKTAGDGVGRKYDFTYDDLNRLTGADFNQNSGSQFDKSAGIDFSVSGLTYDGNGNILTMNQKGFKVGGSSFIDQLTYTYQLNSNKLIQVNDGANDATSKLGDFHYTGTKQSTDYNYDGNGNLNLDNNKAISSIVYNYLNLAQTITVASKGTVSYTYDAAGTKLYKTTVDNTVSPAKTSLTTYIGGFVYQANSPSTGGPVTIDTLQFIAHEEGRARWAYHKYTNGYSNYGFEYDFFEKDHLGNTRVVLTQEKDTAQYLASGEAAYRATEVQLFNNITTTAVARTSAPGYPSDLTITNPNDTVFKVNGNVGGNKTGPSLLLKVMSGDKIDLAVQSFYNTGTVSTPNSSIPDVLASLATGVVNMTAGGKGTLTQLDNMSGSPIYGALNTFMTANDPTPGSKPKAYLNWILLDEQLNYVSSYPQSGAIPVGAAGTLNMLGYTGLPITKNGFLYIWVSNETPNWDVFFDNLKVVQYTGPELEETHYYPFGLTMAGISSKALKTNYVKNNFKYNGKELQNQEFSDGTGLEDYDYGARMLDPQLGVWHNLDPLVDKMRRFGPYTYGLDNPIRNIDPDGMGPYGTDGSSDPTGSEMNSTETCDCTLTYESSGGSVSASSTPKGPSAKTGALISKHVYGGSSATEVGNKIGEEGFEVSSLSVSGTTMTDDVSGFKSQLYQATINGQVEYVYAFAGTEDGTDAIQDAAQVAGISKQYNLAISNAEKISAAVGKDNITFVGHSLGGGLAQAAALATNGNAMTYNPAWLSNSTIENNGLNRSNGNIANYITKFDGLNISQKILQYNLQLNHLGQDHRLPNYDTMNPLTAHKIDSVINSF
jgi:RHS repeat-associated protein